MKQFAQSHLGTRLDVQGAYIPSIPPRVSDRVTLVKAVSMSEDFLREKGHCPF